MASEVEPADGLTSRGKRRPRRPKFLLICPACGREGLDSQALSQHLRGKGCIRAHEDAEARALFAKAKRDPRPWMEHISRITRECESIEAAMKQVPRRDRGGCRAALKILRAQIQTLLEVGPERYEIPRDPQPEIIFPAPPKE